MAQVARRADVAEQLRPRQHAPLEQARLEDRDLLVRHQDVDAEVDRAVCRCASSGSCAADERAAADVAGGQAAPRRFRVGARDGGDRDAKVVGQVAMRRQLRARRAARRSARPRRWRRQWRGNRARAGLRASAATLSWAQYTNCCSDQSTCHTCIVSRPNRGVRCRPSTKCCYPRSMGKRIFLFLLTNLAIVLTLSIVLSVLGVGRYTARRPRHRALAVFCLVWGMGGAFISLQMSRWMAKRATGVQLVDGRDRQRRSSTGCTPRSQRLTRQANLPMPEVGVYDRPRSTRSPPARARAAAWSPCRAG